MYIPEKISTIVQAENFLFTLVKNGYAFHPDDNAHDINWQDVEPPTPDECQRLNKAMAQCCALPGMDVCRLLGKAVYRKQMQQLNFN